MTRALLACLPLLAAATVSRPAAAGAADVFDRQDVRRQVERIEKDAKGRAPALESARVLLAREGVQGARLEGILARIDRRLKKDTVRYARSLQGTTFESAEEALQAIDEREKILRYDAAAWPAGYADGRPLTFVVDPPDAERLLAGLDAMILARESSLREAVLALARIGELSRPEVLGLRDLARRRARERGTRTVRWMRGAAFWSEADAEFYLENAVSAELDAVRAAVEDPGTRETVMQQVRARLPGSL